MQEIKTLPDFFLDISVLNNFRKISRHSVVWISWFRQKEIDNLYIRSHIDFGVKCV